jgi:hypothetical protein
MKMLVGFNTNYVRRSDPTMGAGNGVNRSVKNGTLVPEK